MNNCVDPELLDEGGWADGRTDKNITFVLETVDKSPKVYTQLAREGVVLTQDSDNI